MSARPLLKSCIFLFLLFGCGRDQRDLVVSSKGGGTGGATEPLTDGTSEAASGGSDSGAGGLNSTGGTGGTGTSSASGGDGGASEEPTPLAQPILFEEVRLPDGSTDSLLVRDGIVESFGPDSPTPASIIDGRSLWASPGFVDSHVHLTYLPRSQALAGAGVLAAVDLAAPLPSLEDLPTQLHLLPAGPMITSLQGYPTQSWGRNGYGLEVANVEDARSAVLQLVLQGSKVIKIPLDGENSLTDDQVTAVVAAAHEAGLKVAAHALTLSASERAGALGCDLLAHAPAEELTDEVIAAFSERAVISTLRAFGAAETTKDNLRRLHDAGATVLYGTDFGNTQLAGIDTQELLLLQEIGFTPQESLDAATGIPASYWNIEEGTLKLGSSASFLLLRADPAADITVLDSPEYTFFRGTQLRGPDGNLP